MFLMGNLTSQKILRNQIRANFNLCEIMLSTLNGLDQTQRAIYGKNMAWVAHNLSDDFSNEGPELYKILKMCDP